MKKNLPSLRSLFANISLFIGLLVFLYSLFGTILLIHNHRNYIDRMLLRQAVELRKTVWQLKLKKDSLYQEGLHGTYNDQILAELYQTDTLLTKRQAEYDYVYSKKHVKKLNADAYQYMLENPVSLLKYVLKPTLPIVPFLCLLLCLILYKPVRLRLAKRFTWLNPET